MGKTRNNEVAAKMGKIGSNVIGTVKEKGKEGKKDSYKQLFKLADEVQREGRKYDYLMVKTKDTKTVMELIINRCKRLMINYGTSEKSLYNEEFDAEATCQLLDLVNDFKDITVKETKTKTINKLGKNMEMQEIEEDYIIETKKGFKEVEGNILFGVLASRLKGRMYTYLINIDGNKGNEIKTISIDSNIDIAFNGDSNDNNLSIMDRIEDTATRLDFDAVEVIEGLKGSLSNSQYNFLSSWLLEGKKPYDNTKQVKAIRERLADGGYTKNDIVALKRALYNEESKEKRLDEKLTSIGI